MLFRLLAHWKLVTAAGLVFALGVGAGIGALALGWKGALLLPLGFAGLFLLSLHLALRTAVSYGMKAFERGDFSTAVRFLWIAEIPQLSLYNRRGKATEAFRACKERVAADMLRGLAEGFLQGRL